jgi:hypothetical protein
VKNNLIRLLDIIDNSDNIKNLTNYLMICLYNSLGNTSLPIVKKNAFISDSKENSCYDNFDWNSLYANCRIVT